MEIQENGQKEEKLLAKLKDSNEKIEKLKSELGFLRTTEVDLREREKRFRNIIENSKAGYFFIDNDGLYQDVNNAWLTMHKFSNSDEIIGKHYSTTQVDSDIEKANQIVMNLSAGNPVSAGEFTRKCKDGTVEWHTYSASPVVEKGEIVGLEGFIIDITDRKKTELRFSNLFNNMTDGYAYHTMVLDANGKPLDYKFIEINPRFTELTGLTREMVINKRVTEIIPGIEDDPADWIGKYGKVALFQEQFSFEDYSEGLDKWFNINAYSPEKGYFVAVFTDITQRKKAEEALAAEKEQLSVTLRSIGDGVITTDRDGKIFMLNKVAEDLTGFQQEEASGKKLDQIFRIFNGNTHEPIENPVKEILNTESIISIPRSTILISKDGSEYIIDDSGAPLRDKESNVIGVVIVFRDVTKQRKMEKEMIKNQRIESIGMLAGGIAHDFNNILTSILGNISMLKLSIEKNKSEYSYVSDAEAAANSARDLTQQLLTFSKGGTPIKELTSIENVIRESARFSLHGSGIAAKYDFSSDLWPINVDKGQIGQVIQNLVLNATQAMKSKGTINIIVRNETIKSESVNKQLLKPGRYVKVSVIDTGCGIPAEILPKIFDLYFTTRPTGSGLGLSICHSIIKKHGGIVTVDSEVNKGSKFNVFLPADPDALILDKSKSEYLKKGSGRILILEDERDVIKIMRNMLEILDFEVKFTEDGTETIKEYKKSMESGESYDAVILDLTIPGGMGGKETIKKLLAIDPDVCAIISSGYATGTIMSNYAQFGFQGMLVKPYTITEMGKTLNKILIEK
jgi:PAS domain S-box-containing protein